MNPRRGVRSPMRPPVPPIVHIGAPKTATTWLQTSVLPGVVGRTLCGVAGPDPNLNAAVRSLVVADVAGVATFDADAVAWRLATAGPLLVSDEGLSGLLWARPRDGVVPADREVMVERLATVLPGATIVLVTRAPATWYPSAYSTYLRHGGVLGPDRFREEVIAHDYCDWEDLAAQYRRRFDEVVVLRYEDLLRDPEAFVRDLARTLGLAFDGRTRTAVRNAGLTGWRRTTLRTLNRFRASAIHPVPPSGIAIPGASHLAERIGPR